MNSTTLVILLAAGAVIFAVVMLRSEDEPQADAATQGVWDSLPAVSGRVAGDGWQSTITINPRGF